MRSALPSLLRGWRAALLLAACATPGRASAGCGDYVTVLNAPNDPAAASHHAMLAPDGTTGGTTGSPAKPPCHGPNCSESPARDVPPVPPPAPVSAPVKELTHRLVAPSGADDPRGSFDRDPSSPRPVRNPSSVFHPPRIG
jgi:hypothetical protein